MTAAIKITRTTYLNMYLHVYVWMCVCMNVPSSYHFINQKQKRSGVREYWWRQYELVGGDQRYRLATKGVFCGSHLNPF